MLETCCTLTHRSSTEQKVFCSMGCIPTAHCWIIYNYYLLERKYNMFRWADDSCHRLRCCFLTSYCILMPFAVYQGKKKLSSSDLFVFLEADSLSLGQGTLTISCADTVWPTYGLHLPCCFMLLPCQLCQPYQQRAVSVNTELYSIWQLAAETVRVILSPSERETTKALFSQRVYVLISCYSPHKESLRFLLISC